MAEGIKPDSLKFRNPSYRGSSRRGAMGTAAVMFPKQISKYTLFSENSVPPVYVWSDIWRILLHTLVGKLAFSRIRKINTSGHIC